MAKKIAILVVHGVVVDDLNNYDSENELIMATDIKSKFAEYTNNSDAVNNLEFEFVDYKQYFQKNEHELLTRLKAKHDMDWMAIRRFIIDFGGDALAYQPTSGNNETYEKIHDTIDISLTNLKNRTGDNAPLCVISHSLGTIIANNHFYDLQNNKRTGGNSELERGRTLSLLYTMGSPLPLWALKHNNLDDNFNKTIEIPHNNILSAYPGIKKGTELNWVNFYDKDDVIGYPISAINQSYANIVTDKEVDVGNNFISRITPFSHLEYWQDSKITETIAQELLDVYKTVNPE